MGPVETPKLEALTTEDALVPGRKPAALLHVPEGLVTALLDGGFEAPPWSTFLASLREHTEADYATLLFRPPGRPLADALLLFSLEEKPYVVPGFHSVAEVYFRYHSSLELFSDFNATEGQVYSFSDLYPPRNPKHNAFYEQVVVPSGISVVRMIRVEEASGISAWLTISRRGGEFSCLTNELMKGIAPVLRGALRNYVALERERFAAGVTGDAMRRLRFGWMTLDDRGNVLEYESEADQVLSRSGVLSKGSHGELLVYPPEKRRHIFDAIKRLSRNPQAKPFAITLSQEPWLDMILLPTENHRLSANPRAAVTAYVHGDSWHTTDRCEQLQQLFKLSPSEARLALALTRGMTIAEAADHLGIKISTARKCSKLVYAKSGARGLPDLVRIVMRSVLALAP